MEDIHNKLLFRPLEFIDEIFQAKLINGEVNSIESLEIDTHLLPYLMDKSFYDRIPLLTKENANGKLPMNCLVKFRGLIQDIYDPEFYTGIYKEKNIATNSSKFKLSAYIDNLPENSNESMIEYSLEGSFAKTFER